MKPLFARVGFSENRLTRFALLEQFGHRDPVEEKIQTDQKQATEQGAKNQVDTKTQLEGKSKLDQQAQKQTVDLTSERLNASVQNAVETRMKTAQQGMDAHIKQIEEVNRRIAAINASNEHAASLGDDAALLAQGPAALLSPNERTKVRRLDARTTTPAQTAEVSSTSVAPEAQAKQKGAAEAGPQVATVDAGRKTEAEQAQKKTEEVAAKTAGGNQQLERTDARVEGRA